VGVWPLDWIDVKLLLDEAHAVMRPEGFTFSGMWRDRLQAEGVSSGSIVGRGEYDRVVSDWVDNADIDKNNMTKHDHVIASLKRYLVDETPGDDNQSGRNLT
jgi:hypothetical protein